MRLADTATAQPPSTPRETARVVKTRSILAWTRIIPHWMRTVDQPGKASLSAFASSTEHVNSGTLRSAWPSCATCAVSPSTTGASAKESVRLYISVATQPSLARWYDSSTERRRVCPDRAANPFRKNDTRGAGDLNEDGRPELTALRSPHKKSLPCPTRRGTVTTHRSPEALRTRRSNWPLRPAKNRCRHRAGTWCEPRQVSARLRAPPMPLQVM